MGAVRKPATIPQTDPAPEPAGPGDDADVAVALDRYRIFPGRPIPALDTPGAACYAAQDTMGAREGLMALIPHGGVPPRLDILPTLRSTDCPSLLRPFRWGAVDWPEARGPRFVIVYGQPGGERVVPACGAPFPPVSEDQIAENVIRPLLAAIAEMSAKGLTHRAIRPDNLFYKDSANCQVVLGDAATAPPGATNSAVFETIENGMADPLGRGPGSTADDLYALGVTLLCLATGGYPAAGLDDTAVIAAKIDKGSYAALAGGLRLPPALREAVRGLLADNPKERWSLQDLALWLDGRRLSPIQPSVPKRATRPYVFAGREYFSCRALAHAIGRDWQSAAQVVRDNELVNWIARAVGEQKLAERVAGIISTAASGQGDNRAAEAALAGRLCIALDPAGPIRFKGLTAMFDGLGPLLVRLVREPNGAQPFAQLIASDVAARWIDERHGEGIEARTRMLTLERMRKFLRSTAPGHGVERCLYELNPLLPCQSPIVEGSYVVDPQGLLKALDAAAMGPNPPAFPVDRHVAAFLAARFREDIEASLAATSDRGDAAKAAAGALRALAKVQYRVGPPQLPALASWMGRLAVSIADSYHSRSLRRELREQLSRVVRTGNLVELLNLTDAPRLRELDRDGHRAALAAYAAAQAEIDALEGREGALSRRAEQLGARFAAVLSIFVGLATAGLLLVMRFA